MVGISVLIRTSHFMMFVLAAGGLALSATGIWIAGHRLHIKTRRWRLLRRKHQ